MSVTVVSFGHRSVFPVMFDAESIEKWWKSSLVFKVYCKSPAQKMVSNAMYLAYCSAANVSLVCYNQTVWFFNNLFVNLNLTSCSLLIVCLTTDACLAMYYILCCEFVNIGARLLDALAVQRFVLLMKHYVTAVFSYCTILSMHL